MGMQREKTTEGQQLGESYFSLDPQISSYCPQDVKGLSSELTFNLRSVPNRLANKEIKSTSRKTPSDRLTEFLLEKG
jgi:hypothetical protein